MRAIVRSFGLAPGPCKQEATTGVGVLVLNFTSSSSFEKVAIQPSQTSIAAIIVEIQTGFCFFSIFAIKSFMFDEYFSLPKYRSAQSTTAKSLSKIGFQRPDWVPSNPHYLHITLPKKFWTNLQQYGWAETIYPYSTFRGKGPSRAMLFSEGLWIHLV